MKSSFLQFFTIGKIKQYHLVMEQMYKTTLAVQGDLQGTQNT